MDNSNANQQRLNAQTVLKHTGRNEDPPDRSVFGVLGDEEDGLCIYCKQPINNANESVCPSCKDEGDREEL